MLYFVGKRLDGKVPVSYTIKTTNLSSNLIFQQAAVADDNVIDTIV